MRFLQAAINIGTDIDFPSAFGETPLIVASGIFDPTLIKFLLDAGANPFCRDINGKTALDIAEAFQQENDKCISSIVNLLKMTTRFSTTT